MVNRADENWLDRAGTHFEESTGTIPERLAAFPRYVDRSSLARFVIRYELFKKMMHVQGSIVECGVYRGAGLFAFAQLCALFEPLNHRRRVIGFDTFSGFPSVSDSDRGSAVSHTGGLAGAGLAEMQSAVNLYDTDRPFSQAPKVHLVSGDFMATGLSSWRAILISSFPCCTSTSIFANRRPKHSSFSCHGCRQGQS